VREGAARYRLALMCAERDPLDCHRSLLVARHLGLQGMAVRHILADGSIETGEDAETRLLETLGLAEGDLFRSREALLEEAYRVSEVRGQKSEGSGQVAESETRRQASLPRRAPEEAEALALTEQAADRGYEG